MAGGCSLDGSPAPGRGLLRHGAIGLLALASLLAPLVGGRAGAETDVVELAGTWYVLVHYRDAESEGRTLVQWEDRVWRFERRAEQLLWTEYPVVLFRDATGRFERVEGGRESRVLHAWQPNDGQRAEIGRGLVVAPTGARSKGLVASRSGGWESKGDARARSASVIAYHERWRIAGTPQRPRFMREDVLGGGRAEAVQGSTLYETEETSASGDEIRGRYERDGVRLGRFWMWRSGEVAESAARPGPPSAPPALGGPGREARERLERLLAAGAADSERRSEIRQAIRELVRQHLGQSHGDSADSRERVEGLTRQIETLLLDEGCSIDDVNARLADGRLTP